MTEIDILIPKLIVPDDYQQILVHIEWFLALFHVFVEKWLMLPVEQKLRKNGTYWSQNPFYFFFPRLFLPPNPNYAKK